MAPRSLLRIGGTIVVALAAAFGAQAQSDFPSRPIRIIAPGGPGTAVDTVARTIGDELAKQLGVAIVIDNREGAGGILANTAAAKAPPDGHTLVLGSTIMVSAIQVVNPQPYNPVSDFVPIGRIGEIPMLALVGTESHIKSWADLVSYTKANPGKVNFATAGNGSASHLFTSILHQEFGMNGVFVAYKSTNQALLDVSTNKTDIYLANFPPAAGLISAGKLKPIGVGSTSRLATLPDVPTFAEMLGKPGYRVVLWYGLLAPTGTPPAIVNRLSQELAKAAAAPLLKTRMEAAGGIVSVASGKEMHDQVVSDNTRFASIVKELGLVK